VDRREHLVLSRRLRSLTSVAFIVLSERRRAGSVGTGEALTFLAVHQHADLMLRKPHGYSYTTPTDVAQLTGLDEKTVCSHLARLARQGLLIRRTVGARRVGYRPPTAAERWLTS
jgi:DNA-binding MarR family transcriptional regulator